MSRKQREKEQNFALSKALDKTKAICALFLQTYFYENVFISIGKFA
jgi:hypothetical protein